MCYSIVFGLTNLSFTDLFTLSSLYYSKVNKHIYAIIIITEKLLRNLADGLVDVLSCDRSVVSETSICFQSACYTYVVSVWGMNGERLGDHGPFLLLCYCFVY